ncbi:MULTISPECIES: hypothetical protein [unclassified Streptomyces]|uniref:hypothetical protein n=1 Tax=unclassified Streptomyces TaxID=2593676 RepID=UPI003641729D
MDFAFGAHPEHGFVAIANEGFPAHLAHWYLTREQFEPVPGHTGLFRLTEPKRDGPRRTRQAVHDLRAQGYTVTTDIGLDPQPQPRPQGPSRLGRPTVAQAASTRSPQHRSTPTASPPAARPIPPRAAPAPAAGRTP